MRLLPAAVCLVLAVSSLPADGVEAILARMDQAAPGFHGLAANVQMDEFTAILSDHTNESGTLEMQRLSQNDVRAVLSFPGQRTIALNGKAVRVYYPKMNEFQDYDLGSNSQMLNQFLLLGFGSSGKDLAGGYEITSEGGDKVGGQVTTKLQLIPKNPKVKESLQKVELWIPGDAAYPIQQQFYEPSGNWRKVVYSDIRLNPPIQGKLDFKVPPGAKKQSNK